MPKESAKKPPQPDVQTEENPTRPEWKVTTLADLLRGTTY
jgi:hypothetical protein